VRTAAEIDEFALPVQRDGLTAGDTFDDLRLVRLALLAEKTHRLVPIPDLANDGLVPAHDLAHACLDALQILGRERVLAGEVVVEAVLDGGTDGDLGVRIQLLHGLGHDVGGVVAQKLEPVGLGGGDDGNLGVVVDERAEILEFAVDAHGEGILGEALADVGGDVRAAQGRLVASHRAIGQTDIRHRIIPERRTAAPPDKRGNGKRSQRTRQFDGRAPCPACARRQESAP
jgi:hypothetical protein